MIPYSRQFIDEDDIAAVEAVLRSDWITQGPAIARFEGDVAEYCGAKYACAMSSATAGLHLVCLAMGLAPGKRLWTTPITFVASANCARYCGAEIDFVDIDPRTYCLCPDKLAEKLALAERAGTLPDVVVAVDFAGQPCDWEKLAQLKIRYGFRLVEDAAHSFGAEYRGKRTGGDKYADCTVFSFHPVKILTTGEGGMVVTDDLAVHTALCMLRTHGITRENASLERKDQGAWYYEQQTLGYNYRMTDFEAALGSSQLKKIDFFLARRRAIAMRYDATLEHLPVDRPWQSPEGLSAFHLYPILLRDAAQRRAVFDHLRAAGIFVQVHYIPVHLHPDYMRMGFNPGDFPVAEAYYARTLSLPIYVSLSEAEQDKVVAELSRALDRTLPSKSLRAEH